MEEIKLGTQEAISIKFSYLGKIFTVKKYITNIGKVGSLGNESLIWFVCGGGCIFFHLLHEVSLST